MRLAQFLRPAFALDLRALGAFRIALAAVVLIDLIERSRSFSFYTTPALVDVNTVSIHAYDASPVLAVLSFIVHALVALWLAVGVWSRAAAFTLFLLQASLIERVHFTANGGDTLLVSLLLWASFVPVGARLSWSAKWSRAPGTHLSIASVALVVQVFVCLFQAGLEKVVEERWLDGSALELFLSNSLYPTALGVAFRDMVAPLLPLLTWSTLVLELLVPFAFFLPWWRVRAAALAVALGLMLGISFCLDVGFFPLFLAVGFIALVPSELWDRPGKRARAADTPPVAAPTALERWRGVVVAVLLAFILVGHGERISGATLPGVLVRTRLSLKQTWGMFKLGAGALPPGAVVAVGPLADGSLWDVLNQAPANLSSALPLPMTATTYRERRAIEAVLLWGQNPEASAALATYLCTRAPVTAVRVSYARPVGDVMRHVERANVQCPDPAAP